jgi:HK97 family phage prohead protease
MSNTRSRDMRKARLERRAEIELNGLADQDRAVTASLSSEEPCERWFGREVLVHDKAALDLSRASNLPLLFNHNSDSPIGVVRNVRIEDKRLKADLVFHDKTETARSTWEMVREGWLRGVSIGYSIQKWVETKGSDLVRVTGWSLLEASIVSVPADATVGVNRSEDLTMSDVPDGTTVNEPGGGAVVDLVRVHEKGKRVGQEEGARLERKRIADIHQAFTRRSVPRSSQFDALRDEAIAGGWSLDRANAAILDLLAETSEPATDHRSIDDRALQAQVTETKDTAGRARVELRRDQADSVREGVTLALLVRGQLATPEERAKMREFGFGGYSLAELGRAVMESRGAQLHGLDKRGLAGAVLKRAGGHGTSDFGDILANVATKAVYRGWEEAPETWSTWTRVVSLPDFKQAKMVGLSNFSDLAEIPEQAEYTHGTFSDISENVQLKTYGRLFTISRQAIINDDTNSFTTIPRKMGRAASRMIGDLSYDVLKNGTSSTLDQDSTALFASGHANYVTSGAAPSVTTLNAGFVAMGIQTDPSGAAPLNISPRYLIVPKALENTARTLIAATYDPAGTAGTLTPNPFSGRLVVVADARLDDTAWTTHAGKGWFLAADQNMWDTVIVATLNGETAPYLEEQEGYTTDGVTYKVRIDAAAEPLDYRTLYFNDGQ